MTTYFKQGIEVRGNTKITGNTQINGSTTVGDLQSEDLLAVNAQITTDLNPDLDNQHNLGTINKRWKSLYAHEIYLDEDAHPEGRVFFSGEDGKIDSSYDLQWNNNNKTLTLQGSVAFTGEDNTYQFGEIVIEDNTIDNVTGGDVRILSRTNQKLIVAGDLEVQGTTVSVSSANTAFEDPLITLGGKDTNAILTKNDSYDRGIEYLCYDKAGERIINATDMIPGVQYIISETGSPTTDFIALGADSNATGTLFTASEVASVTSTNYATGPSGVIVTPGSITLNNTDIEIKGSTFESVVADINEEGIAGIFSYINDDSQLVITSRNVDLKVEPTRRIVSTVTRDTTTIVESSNHGFTNSTEITFEQVEGMTEIDSKIYYVETINDDSFYIKDASGNHIDSVLFSQFLAATTETFTGVEANPYVSRNDSIVINNETVTFRGGDIDTIVTDINNADIRNVTASKTDDSSEYLELTSEGVDIVLSQDTATVLANIVNVTVNSGTNNVTVHTDGHSLQEGETVYIDNVAGATQVNGVFYARNITSNTFDLYVDTVTPLNAGAGWTDYANTTQTVLGNDTVNTFVSPLVNQHTEFTLNGHVIVASTGTGTLDDLIIDVNAATAITGVVASKETRTGNEYLNLETNQANVTSDIIVEHKFSSAGGLHINVEDINVVGDVVTITATDHQLIDGTYVILSGVSAPNEINNNRYIVDEATRNTFVLFGTTAASEWETYTSGGVVSSKPLDLLGLGEQTVPASPSGSVYNDVLSSLGFTQGTNTFDLTVGRRVSYVYSTMLDQIGLTENTYEKAARKNAATVTGFARTPSTRYNKSFNVSDGTNTRTISGMFSTSVYNDVDELVKVFNQILTDVGPQTEVFTTASGQTDVIVARPILDSGVDSTVSKENYIVTGVTVGGVPVTSFNISATHGQTVEFSPAASEGQALIVTMERQDNAGPVDVTASNYNGLIRLTGGEGVTFELAEDDIYETGASILALGTLFLTAGTYTPTDEDFAEVDGSTRVDDSTSEYTDDSVEGGDLVINGETVVIAAGASLEDIAAAITSTVDYVTADSIEDSASEYFLRITGDKGVDINISSASDQVVLDDLGLSAGTTSYVYKQPAVHTSQPGAVTTSVDDQLYINNTVVTLTGTDVDSAISDINNANIENVVASKTTNNEIIINYFGDPDNNEQLELEYVPEAFITNITSYSPAKVTTSTAHGLTTDDAVVLTNIAGEMGETLNGNTYYVELISGADNEFFLYNEAGRTTAVNTIGVAAFEKRTNVEATGTVQAPSVEYGSILYLNDITILFETGDSVTEPRQTLTQVVDEINSVTAITDVVASITADNQIRLTGASSDIRLQSGPGSTVLQDLGLVEAYTDSLVAKVQGTVANPVIFTAGRDIIINGTPVTFAAGGIQSIVDDINNTMSNNGILNITASIDNDTNKIYISGRNEIVTVSPGGVVETDLISGIYETDVVKIVSYNHGLVNGQRIQISDIVSKDPADVYELNDEIYTVSNVTANTFELEGVDGTTFAAEYPNAEIVGTQFQDVLSGDEVVINGRTITFSRDSNQDGINDLDDVINDINTEFSDETIIASKALVGNDTVLKLTGYGVNVSVSAGTTDETYNISGITKGIAEDDSTSAIELVESVMTLTAIDSGELLDLGVQLKLAGLTGDWAAENGNYYYAKRIGDTSEVELYNSYSPVAVVEGTETLDGDDSTDNIVAGAEFYINNKLVTISSNTAVTQGMSDVADDILAANIPGLLVTVVDDKLRLEADSITIEKTGDSTDDAILGKIGLAEGTTNGVYSDPVAFDYAGDYVLTGTATKSITDQLGMAGTELYTTTGTLTSSASVDLGLSGTSEIIIEEKFTAQGNATVTSSTSFPNVLVGNTFKINNRVIVFTGTGLDAVVDDINTAMSINPALAIIASNVNDTLFIEGILTDIVIEEHLHGINPMTDLGIEPGTYPYAVYSDAVVEGSKPIVAAGESIYVNGYYVEFSGNVYITEAVSAINDKLSSLGVSGITAKTVNNELTIESTVGDIVLANSFESTTLQTAFGLEPGITRFNNETVSLWSNVFEDLGIEPGYYPVEDAFSNIGSGTVVIASTTTKKGFFGVDKGTGKFTYIPDADIEDNRVDYSGDKGDVHFGNILADSGLDVKGNAHFDKGRFEVDGDSRFYKTLAVGDGEWNTQPLFEVNAYSGDVIARGPVAFSQTLDVAGNVFLGDRNTDRVEVRGNLGVDVQATLRSANVEDLTDNRIVVAGEFGELEDDANLTYDGFKLSVGQDRVELFNSGDVNIQGNLFVANPGSGEATFQRLFVKTLSHTRVPFVSEYGELIDDGSMRYFVGEPAYNNVSTLQLTGDINVDTQATLASANVEDLTMHRIVFVGDNNGELVDDANLMWDTSTFYVNGRAEIDNIEIDGNKITTLGDCTTEEIPETIVNIVDATNSNPIVVTTSTNHGFRNGDIVSVDGIDTASMVEISGRSFEVLAASGTTFSLKGEDGTTYNSFTPVYDFYFIEGPTLDASRLANMPSQSRLTINGIDVTLTNPTNLRQIILDIGTDDVGIGAPSTGANIPGVRAKIWKGTETTGTGTGDENTGLVLQVDKNLAGSVTITEHPRDARNDSLYNAGWTPKVLGFVPGVYNELGFTELADAVPSNPTQTVLVSTTEALNTSGGFVDGSVLEISSPIEIGNRMAFPFSWIQAHILDKLEADSGKIVLGTTGTANTTIEADLTNFETDVDSLYPRVEFRAISDDDTSAVGYRMSIIHNDRTTFTDYDYDHLADFPDTGGLAFEAHDNFIALLGTSDQDTLTDTGSLRYNEPTLKFWAEHYRSLSDTDTTPIGRTDSRGVRMFIGASSQGITLPTGSGTGGNIGQFTVSAAAGGGGGSTNSIVTDWTKAVDLSGSNNSLVIPKTDAYASPLKMYHAGGETAPNTNASLTVASGTTPWSTACVFQPGGQGSAQGTLGGFIWGIVNNYSHYHNISLVEQDGHIWFRWGEKQQNNQIRANQIRVIENADTSTWYGVYIGFRGQRTASPDAAFLGQAFDIHVMSNADGWGSAGSDISTAAEWGLSHNHTGETMTQVMDSTTFVMGNGYGTTGHYEFNGKIASCVITTERNNQTLPDAAEVKSMITDPSDWLAGLDGTTRRAYHGPEFNFVAGGSSISSALSTQVYLMGDGTNDSYSNNIRNQTNPNDTTYTDLQFQNIAASDIETVNIPGLTNGSSSSAPTSIYVTAANGKYFLDGVEQATVALEEGKIYRLDQSDTTNTGHPIRLSTTIDGIHAGGTEFTTGVSYVGTPGTAGSYTEITVPVGTPTLYYYCPNHSGMGGTGITSAPISATWVDQPLSIAGVVQTRPIAPNAPATIDATTNPLYFYIVGSNTNIQTSANVAVWVNNTKVTFSNTASLEQLASDFNSTAPAGVEWVDTNPNGSAATTMVLRVDRSVVSEVEISEDAYSTIAHGAVTGPNVLYPYSDTVYMGFDSRAGVRYGVYAPAGYSSEVTLNEETTLPAITSTAVPTATRALIPASDTGCHLILDTDPTDPLTRIHHNSVAVFNEGTTAITMIEASDFTMMDNNTPSNIVYTIDGNTGNVVTQGSVEIEDTLTVNRALNSTQPTNGSIVTAGGLGVGMDVWIGGTLYVVGDSVIAGNLQLGDQDTDTITFSADVISSILPDISNTFDLGNAQKSWRRLHLTESLNFEGGNQHNNINFPTNLQDGLSITSGLVDFIRFESTAGNPQVHILQDANYTGTIDVIGQSTMSSAAVEDLTDNRVVIVGPGGELEDDSNFTFDGLHLRVGTSPSDMFTVEVANGDTYIAGTLEVDGQSTLASANVEDLTNNRIVIAGVDGELEDDANFTFDATTFDIGQGEFLVDVASGNTDIDGTLDVAGVSRIENTLGTTAPTNGAFTVAGGVGIGENLEVGTDLHVRTDTFLHGDTTIGDSATEDNIYFVGRAGSDLIPNTDNAYDLGSNTLRWANVYSHVYTGDDATFGNIQVAVTDDNEIDTLVGNLTLDSANGNVIVDDNLQTTGIATFENVQQSTENNNGSVVIVGGLGVGMNTNIGGELDVDSDAFYHENVHLDDTKELRFGTDIDATIQWDTLSDTLRVETSSTTVNSDRIELSKTDRTEYMLTADADASVDLYYNGSRKAHTTLEGFTVENQLSADVNFDLHASADTLDSEIHFTAPGMTTATIIADHSSTSTDRNLRLAAGGAENIAIVDDRVFLHGDIDNDRTAQLLGDVMVGKTSQAGNTLGIIGGTGDAQISFYESAQSRADVYWDNSEDKLVINDTRYTPDGTEGVFNLTHQTISMWTDELTPAGNTPTDGVVFRDPSINPVAVLSLSNESSNSTTNNPLLRLSKGTTGPQIAIRQGGNATGFMGASASDNDLYIEGNSVGLRFDDSLTAIVPASSQGSDADNLFDLGDDANRWRDVHFGNELVHTHYTETADKVTIATTSNTVIAEYDAATFGAAKFIITATTASANGTNGAGPVERSATEILVVHDGTTAEFTQYAVINTGTTLTQFDVDLVGGKVRLLANGTYTNTTYNIVQTLIV